MSNQQNQAQPYQPNRYDELCYALFEHNAQAKELLELLTKSLLIETAVVDPSRNERYDCFREGENAIVRSFRHGAAKHKAYLQALEQQAAAEEKEESLANEE